MTYTLLLPAIGNAPTEHVPPVQGESNDDFTQRLFLLMASDGGQRRVNMRRDSRLDDCAAMHSEDMARKNYFSHFDPDGHAPNWRVRQTGYKLPADWPDDKNYCESIAAGYPTPQEAWNALMTSVPHKTHLLGLTDFFAAQVCVGIGYYHLGGGQSVYEHYWTVISCVPEASEA